MRKKVEALLDEMKSVSAKCYGEIRRLQEECHHEVILERPSGSIRYRFIEDQWFPAVKVCADCGLVEEKERMTPLYNTYVKEKKPRLRRAADYQIDEKKLTQVMIHIKEAN